MKINGLMRFAATACLSAALCGGCVIRTLTVRSEPIGAPVYIDEREIGTSPARITFDHYGTRRVRVGPMLDRQGRVMYDEKVEMYKCRIPWYEYFPLDFISDNLIPFNIRDEHEVSLTLPKVEPKTKARTETEVKAVIEKASQFRSEAKKNAEEVP
ncbi:MAG TPA: PEGA domain-containing protein [Candidatus Brocadiia bacterium]|nr:PEGA domain-containing protein [Candidatus Brocadiia bacterium]